MSLSKIAPQPLTKPKNRLSLSKGKATKSDESRFRPVNEHMIAGILGDNENKNTVKSEKKVDRIFIKYLNQINKPENYWNFTIKELDKTLATFCFAGAPQKEGSDHYTMSSLHHIRYALKRILQGKGCEFDITTDPRFTHSQHMFKEACKELKRKGFGHIKRTEDINPSGRSSSLRRNKIANFVPLLLSGSFTKRCHFFTIFIFLYVLKVNSTHIVKEYLNFSIQNKLTISEK